MQRIPTAFPLCLLILLVLAALSPAAHAADTVETWDAGATDIDFYLGVEGFGVPRSEGSVFGDIMLGYGLIDHLSAYLGTTFQTDRFLDQSDPQHYLGLFGTVYESEHFDCDLFLDFSSSGSGAAITPAFELNLDHSDDHSTYGLYLRSGIVFANEPGGPGGEPKIGHSVDLNPGVYWSVAENAQLLLEYSTGYFPTPVDGGERWGEGHLHLGYNRVLNAALELVTELDLSLEKHAGERPWGGFVGLIATLP